MPAVTGGLATLPRAPGPDQPPVTAGQDRLRAAPRVPEPARSHPAQKAPDQHEASAHVAGVADADRLCAAPLAPGPHCPRHAQKAPGSDQPPAPAGQDRLRAAPRVPEPARSHPAQRAPDQDATPADRAGVTGADCQCATFAAARPDCSPVMSPPPDHDPTGHDSAIGAPPASVTPPPPSDQGLYAWSFAAHERQRLAPATDVPVLDAEVQLLQVLIQRLLATDHRWGSRRGRQRRGALVRQRQQAQVAAQLTLIGRAIDVLRRTIVARQALAPDTDSELMQLLDEAAAHMNDPTYQDDPSHLDDPAASITYPPVLDALAAPPDAPSYPDDPAAQTAAKEDAPGTIPN